MAYYGAAKSDAHINTRGKTRVGLLTTKGDGVKGASQSGAVGVLCVPDWLLELLAWVLSPARSIPSPSSGSSRGLMAGVSYWLEICPRPAQCSGLVSFEVLTL